VLEKIEQKKSGIKRLLPSRAAKKEAEVPKHEVLALPVPEMQKEPKMPKRAFPQQKQPIVKVPPLEVRMSELGKKISEEFGKKEEREDLEDIKKKIDELRNSAAPKVVLPK
jgi:hypothetical protein